MPKRRVEAMSVKHVVEKKYLDESWICKTGSSWEQSRKDCKYLGGTSIASPQILQPSFEEETVAQVHHDATDKYRGAALGVDRPDMESRLDWFELLGQTAEIPSNGSIWVNGDEWSKLTRRSPKADYPFMSPIPKNFNTSRMDVVWASPTILKNGRDVVHSVGLGWDSAACMFLQQLVCFVSVYECACKGSICQTCHAIQIHPIFPQFGMVVCGARVEIDVIFNNRTSSGFLCLRQHCLKSLASSRLVGNGCATSLVSESNATRTLRLMFVLVIHVFRIIVHFIHFFALIGKAMATQNSIFWQKRPTFTQLNMYVMWDHRNMSAATLLRLLERWTSSWICLFVQSLHGWIPEVIWGSTSSTKGTKGNCLNGFVGSCFQEVDK